MKMLLHNDYRGYSFVELMIAIGISMILIAGASSSYIVTNRVYVAQESVSDVNTQSKVSHDIISVALKGAGFGTPSDMNLDPVNGYTDIITQVDSTYSTDAITLVGGYRMIGTLWPSGGGPGMACPANVSLGSTQVSIEYSGTEGPNMSDKRFISIDGINFSQVSSCTISGESCTPGTTITLDRALTQNFPLEDSDGDGLCDTGRPVYLVEDVTYCVDSMYNLLRIRRNAVVEGCYGIESSDVDTIAQNIEDIQFAYAVDNDDDDKTDDQNGDDIINGYDFIDGSYISDTSTITAVRLNILARADKADVNFKSKGSPPPVIENRYHYTTNDDYRRRWWQTVVNLRNR